LAPYARDPEVRCQGREKGEIRDKALKDLRQRYIIYNQSGSNRDLESIKIEDIREIDTGNRDPSGYQ